MVTKMMNPIYNSDHSEVVSKEWAAVALTMPIGFVYLTNVPGTVGHNYAKWEVTELIQAEDPNYTLVTHKRVH